MPKLERFDRQSLHAIGERIKALLEPLHAEFGCTVEVNGGTFEATYYKPRVTLTLEVAKGVAGNLEALDFKRMARLFGLEPEDLGKTFTSHGHTYEICGLKYRSYKNPIIGKRVDGKLFKFPAQTVLMALGRGARREPPAQTPVDRETAG